ncbi:holin-like protein [Formivibrio citricus]|uniref:Holin-like protein n=1 Tax=Formivibrio citricus TaxID=83765 RepID=A0A1I4WKG0_9NEIS|nr:CidA/LrgA family protein [Formivibrio citricus]SFN13469.1 holin-like protein [Formivibrio citricus]
MLQGFIVLMACWLAGEVLVNLLALSLPGSVAGMLILLAVALGRRGVGKPTAEVGGVLLSHLALLFVPAGVGLMEHGRLFAEEGLGMLAVLVLSTAVTMAVTAVTLKWLLARRKAES